MHQLIGLFAQHGAWLLFGIVLAARLGAPLPAAPLLVVVGGLAAGAPRAWPAILLASVLANVLGDGAWFLAGRRFGHRVLRLLCRVSLSPDSCVRQSELLLTRWGGSSLVAAKFLPGISVVAAPLAGALGMSSARFLAYDSSGSLLWSLAYLLLGVAFHDQVQRVLDALAGAGVAAALMLAAIVLAWIVWRVWRRQALLRSLAMSRITVHALHELIGREPAPVIIDVRSPTIGELDTRQIPDAVSVPLRDIRAHAAHLPRDRDIVLYCNCPNEVSAARAAQVLRSHGFTRVYPLLGGLEAWVAAGRPVSMG